MLKGYVQCTLIVLFSQSNRVVNVKKDIFKMSQNIFIHKRGPFSKKKEYENVSYE